MFCKFCIFAEPKDIYMATIKAFIRSSRKGNTLCNVRFYLSDGREKTYYAKSNLFVFSGDWDQKREQIKTKIVYDTNKRNEFNSSIVAHKRYIADAYDIAGDDIPKDWLETTLDRWYHPEKYAVQRKDKTFFDYFDEYTSRQDISLVRQKNLRVVGNILKRFEKYNKTKISLDGFDREMLKSFEYFVRNEYEIVKERPSLYADLSAKQLPRKRSRNTIISILERLRPFFLFAIRNKYTENDPFRDYEVGTPSYGAPIFISLKELDTIRDCDLHDSPSLAVQRDIFVFHCLVGCRVSDLVQLTEDNIRDGVLYYIAGKTSKEAPRTVAVPLSQKALQIIDRYKSSGNKLLPFISNQKYNDSIKEIFQRAGITRLVTWLNPLTVKGEQRPINEIASSHMARRTFVGNLYAKVKDPNLVGSLSGHTEGSKAFSRYRDIDLNMKKELINNFLK